MTMRPDIRRLGPGDEDAVLAAAGLFDDPPGLDATRRFLAEPTHHLLMAYGDDGTPIGFVSGVETTHPDKGTELFLYELGVDASARRQGLARERGCYGMWTATEPENVAALATYARAGASATVAQVLGWELA